MSPLLLPAYILITALVVGMGYIFWIAVREFVVMVTLHSERRRKRKGERAEDVSIKN